MKTNTRTELENYREILIKRYGKICIDSPFLTEEISYKLLQNDLNFKSLLILNAVRSSNLSKTQYMLPFGIQPRWLHRNPQREKTQST